MIIVRQATNGPQLISGGYVFCCDLGIFCKRIFVFKPMMMQFQKYLFVLFFAFMGSVQAESTISYERIEEHSHLIHVLKFNPNDFEINLVQSNHNKSKKDYLYRMAQREGALLAINAGFFAVDSHKKAYPVGLLKINSSWVNSAKMVLGAMGWSQTKTLFDHILVNKQEKQFIVAPMRGRASDWDGLTNIISGIPLLIADGDVIEDYQADAISSKSFIFEPHARTAVGLTETGLWVVVVAEQRYHMDDSVLKLGHLETYFQQTESESKKYFKDNASVSVKGLRLKELALVMKQQGCVWALNLDGGRSTGLYYKGNMMTQTLDNIKLPLSQKIHTSIIIKEK